MSGQLEEWLSILSEFSLGDLMRAACSPPTTARELLFQLACAAQRGEPDALAVVSRIAREMGLPTDLEVISELVGIWAERLADPAVRAEGKPLPPVSEMLPNELAQALKAKMEEMEERADRALNPKAPHGTQGGTLDRVREAMELIRAGVGRIEACKRAHIDPRTYDRYALYLAAWGAEDD